MQVVYSMVQVPRAKPSRSQFLKLLPGEAMRSRLVPTLRAEVSRSQALGLPMPQRATTITKVYYPVAY